MPQDLSPYILNDITQIVTAIGVILTAVLGLMNHFQGRKAVKKIEEVHLATNSMKDELVASVRKEATAAGIEQGRSDTRR